MSTKPSFNLQRDEQGTGHDLRHMSELYLASTPTIMSIFIVRDSRVEIALAESIVERTKGISQDRYAVDQCRGDA